MAKQKLKRKFNGKAVNMLAAGETIIMSAIEHKEFLISKRSTWADPFFENLQNRIQAAYINHLGIDSAGELREATQKVVSLQTQALLDLAEFKIQVQEDFKKDKPRLQQILTSLGFTQLHKKVQKGDQEGLIQLLFQFNDNMTAELKADIIAKGTAETTIDGITAHAVQLRDLNITQESLKGSKKEITQAAVTEFNEIYGEVISVAKIAAKFFKGNKAVQEQFSFKRVMKNLDF